MVAVLIGVIGSFRIACCLNIYLFLGGLLTLGALRGGHMAPLHRSLPQPHARLPMVSRTGERTSLMLIKCLPCSFHVLTLHAWLHALGAAELGIVLSMFFNYSNTVYRLNKYASKHDPNWSDAE